MRLHNLDEPDPKTGARGYVRAFLTDRFSKFDNLELLDVATPFIEKHNLQLQIGAATDKGLHLRLLHPSAIDLKTGLLPTTPPEAHIVDRNADVHQFGLHVLNSEIGAYNLQGDFLVFRQICTNGLVVMFEKKHLFSHKHIGIEAHEIRTRFAAGLEEMQDRAGGVFERLSHFAEAALPDPLAVIHRELKANKATDDFINLAFRAYETEPIASKFGLLQAITRAAQQLHSLDQRVAMEEVAGKLLMAA
jgi:hypothetical protein